MSLSVNRWLRKKRRQCKKKKIFNDLREAINFCIQNKDGLQAYRCCIKKHWHVGHPKQYS